VCPRKELEEAKLARALNSEKDREYTARQVSISVKNI
jgi:hypothetical protein